MRRLDPLDPDFPDDVLVPRDRDRSADELAGRERLALEVDAEPGAKFLGIGDGAPDALPRSFDDDAALDAIGIGGGAHVCFPNATFWLRMRSMRLPR